MLYFGRTYKKCRRFMTFGISALGAQGPAGLRSEWTCPGKWLRPWAVNFLFASEQLLSEWTCPGKWLRLQRYLPVRKILLKDFWSEWTCPGKWLRLLRVVFRPSGNVNTVGMDLSGQVIETLCRISTINNVMFLFSEWTCPGNVLLWFCNISPNPLKITTKSVYFFKFIF